MKIFAAGPNALYIKAVGGVNVLATSRSNTTT